MIFGQPPAFEEKSTAFVSAPPLYRKAFSPIVAMFVSLALVSLVMSGCAVERSGTVRASTLDSRQANVSGFSQTSGMTEQPLLAERDIKRVALIIEHVDQYRLIEIGDTVVETEYVTLKGDPLPNHESLRDTLVKVAGEKSSVELVPVELEKGEKLFNVSLWDGHTSYENSKYAGELRAKLAAMKFDAVLWIHEMNLPDMIYGGRVVLGAHGVLRRYAEHVGYAGFEARMIDITTGKTLTKGGYTQMSFKPMPQFAWQTVANRYTGADLNQLADTMRTLFRINAEEALHMLRFYDFSQ